MVKTVYEQYGISEEPLRLTEMERRELTQRYIDQGVFNEVIFFVLESKNPYVNEGTLNERNSQLSIWPSISNDNAKNARSSAPISSL